MKTYKLSLYGLIKNNLYLVEISFHFILKSSVVNGPAWSDLNHYLKTLITNEHVTFLFLIVASHVT